MNVINLKPSFCMRILVAPWRMNISAFVSIAYFAPVTWYYAQFYSVIQTFDGITWFVIRWPFDFPITNERRDIFSWKKKNIQSWFWHNFWLYINSHEMILALPPIVIEKQFSALFLHTFTEMKGIEEMNMNI